MGGFKLLFKHVLLWVTLAPLQTLSRSSSAFANRMFSGLISDGGTPWGPRTPSQLRPLSPPSVLAGTAQQPAMSLWETRVLFTSVHDAILVEKGQGLEELPHHHPRLCLAVPNGMKTSTKGGHTEGLGRPLDRRKINGCSRNSALTFRQGGR